MKTLRTLPLIALLALIAPALAQEAGKVSETARLKSSVTVMRDTVRIGDLVENAGDISDIAIFRAPDLGGTGTVSASAVLEAIRAHDLLVVDTAGVSDIEVIRASREISKRDIEQRVARAFAGQYSFGDAGKLTVTFDREPVTLYVEPTATGDLQIARVSYDPRTSRFDVLLNLPNSAITRQFVMRYSGRVVETMMAPVLTRPFNRGETVKASDVSVEKRPKSEIAADTILNADEVIGYTSRQSLRAGQPLRRNDLAKPEIVKRDEFVTLVYEMPGLLLSVRGKAVESGAEGDLISVLNVQSKRTVQGIVSGIGRVTMLSQMPIATAAVEPEPAEDVPSAPARKSE
jgi:flagella basal body P-ring formation protein FlgA